MYATESDDALVVGGLADNGPAEQAGVRQGDRILAVNEDDVPDLAGLWRRVWASGSAGAEVRLRLLREGGTVGVTVRSGDRAQIPEVAEAALSVRGVMAGPRGPASYPGLAWPVSWPGLARPATACLPAIQHDPW